MSLAAYIDIKNVVRCGRCDERFGRVTSVGPQGQVFVLDRDFHQVVDVWQKANERARRGHVRVITSSRVSTRKTPLAGERIACPKCTRVNNWIPGQGFAW